MLVVVLANFVLSASFVPLHSNPVEKINDAFRSFADQFAEDDWAVKMDRGCKSAVLAVGISMAALTAPVPAQASDTGAIVSCLFSKCQIPLAKCIVNPKCLANVVCINTCNGRDDEIECQIQCGDFFENEVR